MSNDEPGAPPATPLPMLRGRQVWLRASTKADFTSGPIWVNDAENAHFLGLKMPVSEDGAAEFAQMVASQQGKTMFSFAICLLGEDRSIGNVTLRDVDRENGSAEMSIVITDKSLQGKGHGTDALNCLVDFGMGELRLERIYLHVFDYNPRARRSYEKAGFKVDALLRRSRFHRGAHHDVHLMSIIREDWLALDRPRSWELAGP
jgi:RimJ/RimL family protein N-acetyltransferase